MTVAVANPDFFRLKERAKSLLDRAGDNWANLPRQIQLDLKWASLLNRHRPNLSGSAGAAIAAMYEARLQRIEECLGPESVA